MRISAKNLITHAIGVMVLTAILSILIFHIATILSVLRYENPLTLKNYAK